MQKTKVAVLCSIHLILYLLFPDFYFPLLEEMLLRKVHGLQRVCNRVQQLGSQNHIYFFSLEKLMHKILKTDHEFRGY